MGYFAWVERFRTILLPKDHPVTKEIIVYYQDKYLHEGSQALLAALRKQMRSMFPNEACYLGARHG